MQPPSSELPPPPPGVLPPPSPDKLIFSYAEDGSTIEGPELQRLREAQLSQQRDTSPDEGLQTEREQDDSVDAQERDEASEGLIEQNEQLRQVLRSLGLSGIEGSNEDDALSPEARAEVNARRKLEKLINLQGPEGEEWGAPDIPDILREYSAEQILTLIPTRDEYIPTRREIVRHNKTQAEDNSGNYLGAVVAAKVREKINQLYPNGFEAHEAERNKLFKSIVGETTSNGDDTSIRIIFARQLKEGVYTGFDSDGTKALTKAEVRFMKKRRKELRHSLADLGAASVYEVSKMQEDMQEEGWENMLNVWKDIGLSYTEIYGLYTAVKFAHKGTMLTNKYKTPVHPVMRDAEGAIMYEKDEDGNDVPMPDTSRYVLGNFDRTGYVVELAEKVSKHGYQYSASEVQTLLDIAEEVNEEMKQYFYSPRAREHVEGNDFFMPYGENLFFMANLKQVLDSTTFGPSVEQGGDEAAKMAEAAADRMRVAQQAQYEAQIPASAISNFWWRRLDALMKVNAELFPAIKKGPPRHKGREAYGIERKNLA